MNQNKVNEIITDKIIKSLENKNLKWLKDWSLGFGINHDTGKTYQGINALLLNIALVTRGYKSNEWATFKQIKKNGGFLKTGSKSVEIIYYTTLEKCSCKRYNCQEEESAEHVKRDSFVLKYYHVFNIEDTDLKPRHEIKEKATIKEIDEQVFNYWNREKISLGNPAYYPQLDKISMPLVENFNSIEGYYSALTHELIHSTGHKKRLNRKGVTQTTGDRNETYAYEELIAELGSAFFCGSLKIEKDINNTTAYIQSWLKCLKDDKRFIFKACREATKALKHIQESKEGKQRKEEELILITTKWKKKKKIQYLTEER